MEKQIFLPDEIIIKILCFVPQHSPSTQKTYASCARTSWQWYECATPFLYASPKLYGPNYTPFLTTICPSINLHVQRSRLALLVKKLDLGALVHQGSKSTTARLLGRVKGNLESFRAPQASFALNCLPALGKCTRLAELDLSLVSESPPLPDLFRSLSALSHLKALCLPRCSGFGGIENVAWTWPPNLTKLALSGGIDAHFVRGDIGLPASLTELTLEHCPTASYMTVKRLLQTAVRPLAQLRRLRIANMPRLVGADLGASLQLLPQIEILSVGVEFIGNAIFDLDWGRQEYGELLSGIIPYKRLRVLELTNTSGNSADEIEFELLTLVEAVEDGVLPALRKVRAVKSLRWGDAAEDLEDLGSALLEQASNAEESGVWIFDDHVVR